MQKSGEMIEWAYEGPIKKDWARGGERMGSVRAHEHPRVRADDRKGPFMAEYKNIRDWGGVSERAHQGPNKSSPVSGETIEWAHSGPFQRIPRSGKMIERVK